MIKEIETKLKTLYDLKIAVLNDDKSLILCLNELYNRQEPEEISHFTTSVQNGVGFNKIDAPVMTLYKELSEDGLLSEKQLLQCRKRIMKYLPQLIRGL